MQDKTTKNIARRIASNMDEVTQIWGKLNYLEKHGEIPKDKYVRTAISDLTDKEMLLRLMNVPTALTRLKAKIKAAPDGPQKEAWIQDFDMMKAEIDEIRAYAKSTDDQ